MITAQSLMSSKMQTIKTWLLLDHSLGESDYAWISSNSENMKVEYDTQYQLSMDGYNWINPTQVVAEVLITTSCKKQESMLQLKYGDQLKLYRVFNYNDQYYVGN